MAQIFFNNFETTFIGPVQATPTSGTPATELGFGVLQISDGAASVLLNPTGGDFYIVTAFKRAGTVESDHEVLRITAVDNAVPGECRITVLRGQEGTTPKSYVAGDRVAMRATAGSYGNFTQNTDARLTDARTPTGGAGGVLSGTYPNPGFAVDMATQAELDAATGTREPTIAAGTVAQYWRGDKTWQTLNAAAISDSSAVGRSVLTAADAAAARTAIGAGDVTLAGSQTLTNKTIAFGSNTLTDVASTNTAQTLTNKTIAFGSNTLTDVASTNTAQTLTNKTLTDPRLSLGGTNGTAGQVPVSQGAGLPPVWGTPGGGGAPDFLLMSQGVI